MIRFFRAFLWLRWRLFVNSLKGSGRSFVIITHYQRLLNYIVPDHVHVLSDGKIIRSGNRDLALELEEKGYGWLQDAGTPLPAGS